MPGDWRNTARQGGGVILDRGVHLLDQMLNMVDERVVSIFCAVSHVTNDEVQDVPNALGSFSAAEGVLWTQSFQNK